MLIKNEAAMQIMGDWAKAEFAVAGKAEGTDYGCVASPGTGGSYLWLVDNFAFFKPKNDAEKAAQDTLAETVLDPTVQVDFAVKKGSIPVIVAADSGKLDACGKKAFDDRAEAQKTNEVLPSFAHNAAMPAAKTGVFLDVVSQFFTTPSMTSQQAVDQLVAGLSQVQ
jgi:glucose/mannose transport system substrate-binding protein